MSVKKKNINLQKRRQVGKSDIDSKEFMRNKHRFADAFNYFMFDGKQVIAPEALKTMDTTTIALPYGNKAREPIQKFRDLLNKWIVKYSNNAIYAILGIENQSDINYVMVPRNMLYDAICYDEQIRNARKSYKNTKGLTKAERMSGFKKTDKLIPVITLVIYFGAEDWDAPRSLKKMLYAPDERILQFVQDYELHLIEPYKLTDEQLEKFTTDLGLALKFIKYSKDEQALNAIVDQDERYHALERDAFDLMNDITKSEIEPIMRGDKVDMCEAIKAMKMESRQEGRAEGIDEDRRRVATVMIKAGEPLEKIVSYSNLAVEAIKNIANSLGASLA